MFLIDRIRNSGIVARLSASFVAVTALAVAANFLADHAANVETTRIERVVTTVAAAPPPMPVQIEAPVTVKPDALPIGAAVDVLKSLEQVYQSALARTGSGESDAGPALAQAKERLTQASRALEKPVRGADSAAAARLQEQSNAIGLTADQLAACADQRRLAFTEYRRHLLMLDEHLKGALDSSFKILGRFIARQYLLQLSTGLEAVRKRYDESLGSDAASDKLTALAKAEHDLAVMVRDNTASLQRVQGQPWLDFLNNELGQLAQHRGTLQQQHQDYVAARTRLLEQKIELATQVQRALNALHLKGPGVSRAAPAVQPAKPATLPPAAVAAPVPEAVPDTPTETITVTPRDTSREHLIAWITFAVVVCVFVVSLFTVLSIIRPVRRLLRAAAQLAHGDLAVRVPTGGLKELDALGRSFNVMAEGLAQADEHHRSYQTRLEQEVASRTHELQELAERDPLTSLANRRVWQTMMESALSSARRESKEVGVFFIDLDNFKTINDSLGHSYGDRVLILVADRLNQVSSEFGFAARVGGDEFCVVCTEVAAAGSAARAGALLVEAFRQPVRIEQRELMISVSIGMSVFPAHGQTPTELLSAADAALFRAKDLGRNQLNVYTPELLASANERFGLEQRLRRALERDELALVFQPEVAVDTLQVVMVEALLRWRQPDGRLASPGEFLPVAEASGLIADFDAWVLENAIAAASEWHHGSWPAARVAINVSPRQLVDAAFADRVHFLLKRHRVPPRCIEIELTETALQTGSAVIETLRKLRALGVPVALDDFGTGYSSLTSLEQLPLSRVKLDRSLITGLGKQERSEAIVHTIVTLCRHLDLDVTAEGIETNQQLTWLLQYKELTLQGYLLSRPLPQPGVLPALEAVGQHVIFDVLTGPGARGPVAIVDSPLAAVS